MEDELWDGERRRLTVLLDPARIKRGLAVHRHQGYPLKTGRSFQIVVDDGLRDATGTPLRAPAERRYLVGTDERRHLDPGAWDLAVPAAGTRDGLEIGFDRPLDHALLGRCLSVTDPSGRPIRGVASVGPEERSWHLMPTEAWTAGAHHLVVDPTLEDVAGNSVSRVFDRDLRRGEDDPRAGASPAVTFHPV
jgi:hypothetical protein